MDTWVTNTKSRPSRSSCFEQFDVGKIYVREPTFFFFFFFFLILSTVIIVFAITSKNENPVNTSLISLHQIVC